MKNPILKKIHLLLSSLFLFVVHLPNLVAKSKVDNKISFNTLSAPKLISDTSLVKTDSIVKVDTPSLYDSLKLGSLGLGRQVFDYAIKGYNNMKQMGRINNDAIISIIDFSKPSSNKRLFIIDLKHCKILFNTYVAHGMNSGKEFARDFSNVIESNKSSLGFYTTEATYSGKHGYSLHLLGVEKGINDNAYKRDIVVHGANYVNEQILHAQGFLGRSWGCPAIPQKLNKPIIDKIKNGTCLFIFGNNTNYLSHSALLDNSRS